MTAITLYTMVPSRGAIAHWMLEETGVPYEVKILASGAQREADYLAINPMGKVPAIVHKGQVVSEAAAICLYLAEAFPEAGLDVPVGDARRGAFLKWLFFGPSCIEPAVLDKAFPRERQAPKSAAGYGDFDTVMDVVEKALAPGPYILGDVFTAADVVIGSQLRWGMMFGVIPKRAAFTAYVSRLEERPALRRQMAWDEKMKKPA